MDHLYHRTEYGTPGHCSHCSFGQRGHELDSQRRLSYFGVRSPPPSRGVTLCECYMQLRMTSEERLLHSRAQRT